MTTYADGQRAAAALRGGARPPTALFCTTDTLAIGAVRGAALAGKAVPADVSVVGYGATEITAYTQPPLTCVVQEKLTVGTRAVRVLLQRIAGGQGPAAGPAAGAPAGPLRRDALVVPTRLVVRASTAPAPVAGVPAGGRNRRPARRRPPAAPRYREE